MDLLEELNKNGQTIILVTHDIQVAVRGKRVLYIEDGRIEGELKVTESGDGEEKLIHFLQKKGW